MIEQFKKDINQGLSQKTKTLPSKYFYDAIGDALFVKIMHMSEYYLTRSELDIFRNKTIEIIKGLKLSPDTPFDLIELGAGDGTKTIELLRELSNGNYQFNYLPVDISKSALIGLEKKINQALPDIKVISQQGDYFDVLTDLKKIKRLKIVFFLGSNIGNLTDDNAIVFINALSDNLTEGDQLFLGVDLIKSEDIILPAYNDRNGFTRDFNLNLLKRINNELGADFNIDNFEHAPKYDSETGIAYSYLKSLTSQTVKINALNKSFEFGENEMIHTEISRKYNDQILNSIIKDSSLTIQNKLLDNNMYFADYILKKE